MRPIIRYWGRKAGGIAEPYISKYSEPNEIILDPFGGTGSIIKTALLMGRKGIYSDLNPLATHIASVEIEGITNVNALTLAASKILGRQRVYYDEDNNTHWISRAKLYEVKCICGIKRQALYFIWHDTTVVSTKVKCHSCGNPLIKIDKDNNITATTKFINATHATLATIKPIYWYPKASLWYPNGPPFYKRRKVNTISELFTQRNLLVLSTILEDIKRVKTDERTRHILLVAFASILYQASKMCRANGGSWSVNCYWLPTMHIERNPYLLFENALKRISSIKRVTIANSSNDKLVILNADAAALPLPDNSVHLVVTDPPFTDEIQYFELSYLAASWLGLPMPFEREIIVNPMQGKGLDNYLNMLAKSFSEIYRILKHGRTAIIMLHEEDEEVLREMINRVKDAGFTIGKIDRKIMIQRQIGDRDDIKGKRLLILSCHK